MKLLDEPPEVKDKPDAVDFNIVDGEIEFGRFYAEIGHFILLTP